MRRWRVLGARRARLGLAAGFCCVALAAVTAAVALLAAAAGPAQAAISAMPPPPGGALAPDLQAEVAQSPASARITAIVVLRDQANLADLASQPLSAQKKRAVVSRLRARAASTSPEVEAVLTRRGLGGELRLEARYWIFNGLAVSASPAALQELAALPQVKAILPNTVVYPPVVEPASGPPQPNLTQIGAPDMWAAGYRGQGVVVASLDTGVDVTHPDLAAQWRGGSNSWYDPYGQHPITPTDTAVSGGHGTETMGVMVGGDLSGTSIGVAPAAKWIAAKIFSDTGTADSVHIHLAFQWVLAPGGNPADAPQIVNSSWDYPPSQVHCYLEYQPDLESLRAAGILPVFAAGNYGPNLSTDASPANNLPALAVGAVNGADSIASFSSRGPTTCGDGGVERIFPALVAPGVGIYTTSLNHGYAAVSGTSFSAPHVSGALALLLSDYAGWTATDLQTALLASVKDLGSSGPDNDFGYGRLDVVAARNWLILHAAPFHSFLPVVLR